MRIVSNRQWRDFVDSHDVPEDVLSDQFDFLDEDEGTDGFFRYRRVWYHVSQFMRISDDSPFGREWQGYSADSFFSGVLITTSPDGERYRVGTYY